MDIISILDWVGRITSVIFLVTLIWGISAWFRGILPALIRLGKGLSRRKIAIFAKGGNLNSLESLLVDAKLFNKKNLIGVSSDGDLGRAEQATLFLVLWNDWGDSQIKEILRMKKDNTALIVYAPDGPKSIPDDKYKELNDKRNVIVVNLRGRLLNDVIGSLITTSYQ